MEKNIIDICREYACQKHLEVNQSYNDKPYSFHLRMVYDYAVKYQHLLPKDFVELVLASAWVHDLIEDARETYNDVYKATNRFIAEIAYACTNEKGKNREERANAKYYSGIRNTPYATFIKICDRLANARYSKESGSSMFKKYKKELEHFKEELYTSEYDSMWVELENLLCNESFIIDETIILAHSCCYSKSMNQPYPRLCVICGKPEKIN